MSLKNFIVTSGNIGSKIAQKIKPTARVYACGRF